MGPGDSVRSAPSVRRRHVVGLVRVRPSVRLSVLRRARPARHGCADAIPLLTTARRNLMGRAGGKWSARFLRQTYVHIHIGELMTAVSKLICLQNPFQA